MKKGIHPKYHSDSIITCVCGHTFTTGSTKPSLKVDICAKCHPFYTGQQKFVDSVGRIERFQKKQKAALAKPYLKKIEKKIDDTPHPRTLREMLQQQSTGK